MTNTLPILIWPNDKLRQESEEVTIFDSDLELLGRQLLDTMKARKGVGLAAPQCGIMKRVIAVWIDDVLPLVFVNPVIIEQSEDKFSFKEGCLSVPGYFEARERAKKITLEVQDVTGKKHTHEWEDLYAFCIQHEIDHLNGKVFVDDLSMLKKDRIKAKIRKYRR